MQTQALSLLAMACLCPLLAIAQAPSRAAAACRSDTARQIAITGTGLGRSFQNPCFSPNGRVLAFTNFATRYNTGKSVVRTVPVEGGAVLRAVSPTSAQSVNLPGQCWSAATDEVVYSSDVTDRDEIYLAPAAGGSPAVRVTRRPGSLAWEPSISPVLSDGKRWIVFESHSEANPDAGGELWKIRSDGAELARLTVGHNDRQPEWSPKGDKIVFQRQLGPESWDVFTLDVATGAVFNVTNAGELFNTDASWSPSGNYIVYSSGDEDIEIANVFVIPAAGGARIRVTRSCGLDGAPGWSPDGGTIAFESAPFDPDAQGSTTLWMIDAPAGVR
ncbi:MULTISPECIES: PD40 domain-containing protein [unclassified Lysobacter]|uniref:TolB family protein n=1 Tax=unclassified Lysobacter TaxID=2635362 RepID=UPI001BEB0B3D|nr:MULTISPECIES: PD40 domain-containing protein [unclassified Lysobacter]MBT2746791.1 PD40 domain-containing protein [Lysobacter sp. ISL-42]MBT2750724.1 PD40 domain-containing protein [Lysobacter sp. ISL-50]MBT2779553.1 PD40 domain-containing protein [Lysobacter sp. ISL-54]MBT2782879.1 PD40 domain-containing protein [Lysobacter sp. ISL-52]